MAKTTSAMFCASGSAASRSNIDIGRLVPSAQEVFDVIPSRARATQGSRGVDPRRDVDARPDPSTASSPPDSRRAGPPPVLGSPRSRRVGPHRRAPPIDRLAAELSPDSTESTTRPGDGSGGRAPSAFVGSRRTASRPPSPSPTTAPTPTVSAATASATVDFPVPGGPETRTTTGCHRDIVAFTIGRTAPTRSRESHSRRWTT